MGQTDTSEREGVFRAVLAHPVEIPEKHVRFITNKEEQAFAERHAIQVHRSVCVEEPARPATDFLFGRGMVNSVSRPLCDDVILRALHGGRGVDAVMRDVVLPNVVQRLPRR